MAFIELREDLQKWDVDKVVADLSNLIELTGSSWIDWKQSANIIYNRQSEKQDNLNLTSNPAIFSTLYDRMWRHSGCLHMESYEVDDRDLYILHPELEGTYTGDMIHFMEQKFGPIRVRVHNKVHYNNLYWHVDKHAPMRYHLVLWTYPGAFIVWTDLDMEWRHGFDPEQAKHDFNINAKFMPMDGQYYSMETGNLMHGVCNIGVGRRQSSAEQSRCHFTFTPVNPRIR